MYVAKERTYERKINLKLILAIIATGLMSFTGVVVETAMNVTFPTLMKQFQVSTSTVQWITTGYLLVLSVIIPLSSFLKKRFATKSLFLVAVLLFIFGIFLDAMAPSFMILLFGRLMQGVGTGIALPLMFNIVLEQVPFEKMGLMMGVATLITAIAPAVGPSFGGMIVNSFGWRMIFVSLLPLLVIALFLGIASIQQVSVLEKIEFDWLGYLFLVLGFAAFIFATSFSGTFGWMSFEVILLMFVSILTLASFVLRSKKNKMPMIDMRVFKNRPFVFSALAILLIQFICLGLGFLIPNYAQLVLEKNAFVSGCILLPGCILGAALTPFSGRILDKLGAKKPILAGNISVIFATVLFALFSQKAGIIAFAGFYLFFAAGQGFTMGNTMTNGLKQLPQNLNKDGNAVLNTLQQLSGAIGTSIVTSIVEASQKSMPQNMENATQLGSRNAFVLLCILAFVLIGCSICVFHFIEKKDKIDIKEEITLPKAE